MLCAAKAISRIVNRLIPQIAATAIATPHWNARIDFFLNVANACNMPRFQAKESAF